MSIFSLLYPGSSFDNVWLAGSALSSVWLDAFRVQMVLRSETAVVPFHPTRRRVVAGRDFLFADSKALKEALKSFKMATEDLEKQMIARSIVANFDPEMIKKISMIEGVDYVAQLAKELEKPLPELQKTDSATGNWDIENYIDSILSNETPPIQSEDEKKSRELLKKYVDDLRIKGIDDDQIKSELHRIIGKRKFPDYYYVVAMMNTSLAKGSSREAALVALAQKLKRFKIGDREFSDSSEISLRKAVGHYLTVQQLDHMKARDIARQLVNQFSPELILRLPIEVLIKIQSHINDMGISSYTHTPQELLFLELYKLRNVLPEELGYIHRKKLEWTTYLHQRKKTGACVDTVRYVASLPGALNANGLVLYILLNLVSAGGIIADVKGMNTPLAQEQFVFGIILMLAAFVAIVAVKTRDIHHQDMRNAQVLGYKEKHDEELKPVVRDPRVEATVAAFVQNDDGPNLIWALGNRMFSPTRTLWAFFIIGRKIDESLKAYDGAKVDSELDEKMVEKANVTTQKPEAEKPVSWLCAFALAMKQVFVDPLLPTTSLTHTEQEMMVRENNAYAMMTNPPIATH